MIEHKPLYPAMLHAVSQTLENMAFTEVMENPDQDSETSAAELVWSSLLIRDPVQGEICLAIPQPMLKNLTSNIFAQDENEVTQAQQDDILNEMLNTIAGLFMTNLLTDDQEYKLGLPQKGEGELPAAEAESVVWHLTTGDGMPLQLVATGASLIALNDNAPDSED